MKTPRISVKIFRILGFVVLLIIAVQTMLYQSLTKRNIPLMDSVVFSFTAIGLFLFAGCFLVNSLIGKKIVRLREGFDALTKGNLNVRLTKHPTPAPETQPGKHKDELDFLMQSFDEMAQRLEDSDTKRKQQEKQLRFLATHDPLTGLPNRRLLEHALKKAVFRVQRGGHNVFILMDLDNFKFVNDTLGHSVGDQVLVTLTELLKKQLRTSDLLARFGGDEFALLLVDDGIDEAEAVAKRMCQAIEDHRFVFNNHSFHLGLSMGVVPIDGTCSPEVILSQADTAMYSAKRYGRNRVVLFRADDHALARISEANEWATRIKDALLENRFVLHFQPIVRLSNNHVEHYEALIRMKTETGELISPENFIPAAEQFGLMPQLDRWVVKRAIHTLHEHSNIRLFINLSCFSLLDIPFLEFIEDSLLHYGIEPRRLGFEITETAIIQDFVLAEHWIHRLKSLGCNFALDDFGSGFNSFLYLRRLPVDQLKLDGVFIRNLGIEPSQLPLVQAMHQLAMSLGIETVAEFVEDENAVKILKQLGVTYGQGFHLGKPDSSLLFN